jgi:hypothetical protein
VPVYFLNAKLGYTIRKMGKDKVMYEIQEQIEVPVWYTGPFQALAGNTKGF